MVALVDLALVAVEDGPAQVVAALGQVGLALDVAPGGLIVNVGQDYVESTSVKSRRSAACGSELVLVGFVGVAGRTMVDSCSRISIVRSGHRSVTLSSAGDRECPPRGRTSAGQQAGQGGPDGGAVHPVRPGEGGDRGALFGVLLKILRPAANKLIKVTDGVVSSGCGGR